MGAIRTRELRRYSEALALYVSLSLFPFVAITI